ncbi:hypothetical protein ACMTRQ_001847, partial [Campylobacter jejuni]
KILMQETSKIKLLNHYKEFCEEIFYNICKGYFKKNM